MADTILNYIKKTKNETISMSPFNEVDSLILCQFSYLKFDGMIPNVGSKEYVTLRDIYNNPYYDLIYTDERYAKNNRALFEGMLNSRRFGNIKIHSYIDVIDKEREVQFAAMVVQFENGLTYVAFRGTDDNLIGWKEDLNLAFSKPIPGQILSVQYLEGVAGYIKGPFMIGGHSKGGNLALYSSMKVGASVRCRITDIFNHDGPGLRPDFIDEEVYDEIRGRIKMTVPHSSLVGMLLLNHHDYRVVESKNPGLMQHDPFSWKVKGHDFILEDSISEKQAAIDKSINEVVMAMNEEQTKLFVDTVYEMMLATGVNNLNEIIENWTDIVPKVADAIKDIEPETKETLFLILTSLWQLAGEYRREDISAHIEELKEYLENVREYTGNIVEQAKAKKNNKKV